MRIRKAVSRAAAALCLGALCFLGAGAQEVQPADPVPAAPRCPNTKCLGLSLCDYGAGLWCELKQNPSTCTNHSCVQEPIGTSDDTGN